MSISKSSFEKRPKIPDRMPLKYSDYYYILGLFLFTFLMYANTLGHSFVLDDPLSLALNDNVTSGIAGIGDIIKGSYRENNFGGQLYRPISLVQFAIEWYLSPNNPLIHHFFNIFWYGLTIGLIYAVLRNWAMSQSVWLPLLVALFFAVHPIHTEVVANIKSRDEIMSLFFVLLALFSWHSYLKKNLITGFVFSVVFYFTALLSKETAVTMFPIFGLLAWYVYQKDAKFSIIKGLVFLLPVLLLLSIRHSLFGGQTAPPVSMMDNPIVLADGFGQRIATAMILLLKYFQLLVFPHPLSSDYSYTVIPLTNFTDWKVWVSIIIHLGMVVYAILGIRKRNILSLCILGYLMAISLFSQIPLVIGTMFGERLVYLASFWWMVGVMHILNPWIHSQENSWHLNKSIGIIGLILVIILAILTINRSSAWESNFTLFTTDAATYPRSVRLNNGAAEEMLRTSNATNDENKKNEIYQKAEEYCNKIMSIKPVPTAFLTLGNIRLNQKKYEDAIKYYDQVNDLQSIVDVNKALAYRELGRVAGEKEQNIQKSQDFLSKSLSLNDKDAETWFLMGVSHGVSGNHQLAAEHFEKAYNLNPSREYANNIILAYKNLGNQNKVAQYQKILENK